MSMDMIRLDVYFDYLCPYVHRAIVWLEQVKAEMEPTETPWGTYKIVIFDPDGYRLGFIED